MPVTRVHRSGGKGAPHFIFKHSEASLALGNCDGKISGKEWFSFRAANRYIVAPPSIHPESGNPYTVAVDIEPTPIPDWVVERIRVNGAQEQGFGGDMPELDDDFDFDDFVDWAQVKIGDEDGGWYALKECPVAGRRHKGQGVRGCALFYDGGHLGFRCHAAECPSNMDRKPGQGGIGFLLSFLTEEKGAYDGAIWPRPNDEELAAEFGAVTVVEAPKPNSVDTPTLETGDEIEETEKESQYPELAFPYDEVCLPGSMLRKKADSACRGGGLTGNKEMVLDPGLVVEAILTLASALPYRDEMLGTRVNRFACLLAMSRAGKDVAWRRAAAVLGLRDDGTQYRKLNPVGHAQMIIDLGDTRETPTKENRNPAPRPGPRNIAVLTSELRGVLKLANNDGSKIFEQLCEFYDENKHQARDRGSSRLVKMECRVSWGTSLAIGDGKIEERKFTQAFGDNTNDGIGGRMFWGFSARCVDPRDLAEWRSDVEPDVIEHDDFMPDYASRLERHEVTDYAPGVRESYTALDLGADNYPGALTGLIKTMIAIALVNLHKTITMEDFNAALVYVRYQAKIRRVFQASQADDGQQAKASEMVRRAIRKEDTRLAKAGKPLAERWVNVRRLAQRNEWALRTIPLGIERTVKALHVAGDLSLRVETDKAGRETLDWQYPRARHIRGGCWCGETHED